MAYSFQLPLDPAKYSGAATNVDENIRLGLLSFQPHGSGIQFEWRGHATLPNVRAPLQPVQSLSLEHAYGAPSFDGAHQGYFGNDMSIHPMYANVDDSAQSKYCTPSTPQQHGHQATPGFDFDEYLATLIPSRLKKPLPSSLEECAGDEYDRFMFIAMNSSDSTVPSPDGGQQVSAAYNFEFDEESFDEPLTSTPEEFTPSLPLSPLLEFAALSALPLLPSSLEHIPHAMFTDAPSISYHLPPSSQNLYPAGLSHIPAHHGGFLDAGNLYAASPYSCSPSSSGRTSPEIQDPMRHYRHPLLHRDSTPVSRLTSPEASYYPMPPVAGPSTASGHKGAIVQDKKKKRQAHRHDARHNPLTFTFADASTTSRRAASASCPSIGTSEKRIKELLKEADEAAQRALPPTVKCAWDGCGVMVNIMTVGAMVTHLRQVHHLPHTGSAQCGWRDSEPDGEASKPCGRINCDGMVRHLKSAVHLGRTVNCPTCQQTFARPHVLARHLRGGRVV
ncbi:hypothetical protein DFH09DRAFT_1393589 [Mycena vulgaris]|nr:hypothetical protein DFH09DRAFT_1393589 [Mycena vulgaris]